MRRAQVPLGSHGRLYRQGGPLVRVPAAKASPQRAAVVRRGPARIQSVLPLPRGGPQGCRYIRENARSNLRDAVSAIDDASQRIGRLRLGRTLRRHRAFVASPEDDRPRRLLGECALAAGRDPHPGAHPRATAANRIRRRGDSGRKLDRELREGGPPRLAHRLPPRHGGRYRYRYQRREA